jgi:PAS domain S-box-containing protein
LRSIKKTVKFHTLQADAKAANGVAQRDADLGLLQEIDRLKKALESQQIRNDALINSLGEGLMVINTQGLISQINTYALNALGFTAEELLGRWFPGAIVVVDEHGRHIDPLSRPVTEALTEGQPVSEYTSILRRDGTPMPVFLTVSPILIDGRPGGAIEVFRDLTKERELDLAKEDFVSLASHQLRTPVTGVKAILSMLHDGNFGPVNEKQARYLSLAIDNTERQLDIIEDLLSVARADAGTLDLELDYIDVTELLRTVARDHEPEIAARAQSLQLEAAEVIRMVVDGPKMQMVVDNLLSNASKYTPQGGRIEAGIRYEAGAVHIWVKDTGIGIAQQHISAAFAKFGRVENDLTAPAGGTGLGLYLAKKIVTLHNGDIRVTSRLGEGSVFEVVLPHNQQS